jgi:hypothetical protein
MLQDGYDPENFKSCIDQIVESYAAGQIERSQGITFPITKQLVMVINITYCQFKIFI